MNNTPAHDRQAEEAVLSALLINPAAMDDIPDLQPKDFYLQAHELIFSAMATLHRSGQPIDLVTVAGQLQAAHQLDKIGGAAFLSNIADAAPMAMNTAAYARIIKSCALNRQVLNVALMIQQQALSGDPGEKVLDALQSEALKIQASSREDGIKNLADIIDSELDRIERALVSDYGRGHPLGFSNLDRHLVTIDGKLIIIAGRPKMGKTSFAVTCMRNLDRAGVKTGILSIEMPGREIVDKWLSMESGVNSAKFGRFDGMTPDEFQKVHDAASKLSTSNIMIDDSGSIGIEDVKRKCRKMVREGAQVIFIDQLSQIRGNPGEDRFSRFANNTNEIALLKKELNIPIFLLAQLNRDLEKRSNKEPIPADLKMTGNLEEDADAVIFIFRPEVYATTDEERRVSKGIAIINLAMNRHGAPYRDTRIRFKPENSLFYQLGEPKK